MYYLYFIEDEHYRVKIGVTNDLEKRLATHQCGNADELEIVGVWTFKSSAKCYQIETLLHRYYSLHKIRGEWYRLPKSELRKLISLDNYVNREKFIKNIKEELC